LETGSQRILIYRPGQLWIALAVLVLVLAAAGGWLYQRGVQQGVGEARDLWQERPQLLAEIEKLHQEKRHLADQLAVLERASQIDRQASLEVRQSLGELQEELAGLREELAFYQGIMSPGDVEPGIRVQKLYWEPVSSEGLFRYDLTLVQVKRNDQAVRGVVHLSLEGELDGHPVTLALAELTEPAVENLAFRFRYFQHFEGEVRIPHRFRPRTVHLRVEPAGRGAPPRVERSYDWPA
jgi:sirohydrochlorin ferrochelatase